jgi:thiol-disulfide isomerase/thioredoxin
MRRGVVSESNLKTTLMVVARSSARVSLHSGVMLNLAYDKLAEELEGKVNIVAVDCDAHRPLCSKNGVRGFPTIKMYSTSASKLTSGSTERRQSTLAPDLSKSSKRLPSNLSSRESISLQR